MTNQLKMWLAIQHCKKVAYPRSILTWFPRLSSCPSLSFGSLSTSQSSQPRSPFLAWGAWIAGKSSWPLWPLKKTHMPVTELWCVHHQTYAFSGVSRTSWVALVSWGPLHVLAYHCYMHRFLKHKGRANYFSCTKSLGLLSHLWSSQMKCCD